jgi:hypothetical protein
MRFIPLLAAALLVAIPAGAVDLTGTWIGSFSCTRFVDGIKEKFTTKNEVLLISQSGSQLNVEWVGFADQEGIAINDARNPDEKGAVALIDCETTTDLSDPMSYAELANLQVKVSRAKGKGTIKGLSVHSEDGDITGQCKWNFKLMDLADPDAAGCP